MATMTAAQLYTRLAVQLRKYLPDDQAGKAAVSMIAIAKAESGLNAKAENKSNIEDSVGLFQINMNAQGSLLKQLTGSDDPAVWRSWLQDPINNANAAVEIYHRWGNSFNAWTTWTNGTAPAIAAKLPSNSAWGMQTISGASVSNSQAATTAVSGVTGSSSSIGSQIHDTVTKITEPLRDTVTRVEYVAIGLVMAVLGLYILIKTLAVPAVADVKRALNG